MDHVVDVDWGWGENKFVIEVFPKLIEKRGVQDQVSFKKKKDLGNRHIKIALIWSLETRNLDFKKGKSNFPDMITRV